MVRRGVWAVVVAWLVLVSGLGVPARADDRMPAPGDSAGAAVPGDAVVAERAAVAKAKASGSEVEVSSLTTDRRRIVAKPDGTFRGEFSAVPKRMAQQGSWRDIDRSLVVADGRVRQAAAPERVSAAATSADSALVRVEDGDVFFEFTWLGRLPRPTVEGALSVYRGVAPGVDVAVELGQAAQVFFVVNEEAAAARVAESGLKLGWRASAGIQVRREGHRWLAVDAAGVTRFDLGELLAWDSAAKPGQGLIDAVSMSPDLSARQRVEADVSGGVFTIRPEKAWLTGGRSFPLVIDPGAVPVTKGTVGWSTINSYGGAYWSTTNSGWVGKQGWATGAADYGAAYRTYVNFVTDFSAGTKITSATLRVDQKHSPQHDCGTQSYGPGVAVQWADIPNANTRWSNQPPISEPVSDINYIAVGHEWYCPTPVKLAWNVTGAVQASANARYGSMSFRMISMDEGNRDGWRRFLAESATLEVNYDHLPWLQWLRPVGAVDGDVADSWRVGSTTVKIESEVHDADGDTVGVDVQFRNPAGISLLNHFDVPGDGVAWLEFSGLHEGDNYFLIEPVTRQNGAEGGWLRPFNIVVDTQKPVITATRVGGFVAAGWHGDVGPRPCCR